MKRKIVKSVSVPVFEKTIESMPTDDKAFVDKSLEITHYIMSILEHRGLRQKDLAAAMGKSEAEVSKWLSGLHNYTLKSLTKMEVALNETIICLPSKVEVKTVYDATSFVRMNCETEKKQPNCDDLGYHPYKSEDQQKDDSKNESNEIGQAA